MIDDISYAIMYCLVVCVCVFLAFSVFGFFGQLLGVL